MLDYNQEYFVITIKPIITIDDNDMLSYSLTTMIIPQKNDMVFQLIPLTYS